MKKVLGLLAAVFIAVSITPVKAATKEDVQSIVQMLSSDPKNKEYRDVVITYAGESLDVRLAYVPNDGYGLTANPNFSKLGSCLAIDADLDGIVEKIEDTFDSEKDAECASLFGSLIEAQVIYDLAIQELKS